jgi:hypothetical protein
MMVSIRSRFLPIALLTGVASSCSSPSSPGGSGGTPKPADVIITPSSVAFDALQATQQLTAVVRDQNGAPIPSAPVSWASGDATVVAVGNTGLVTAIRTGNTRVTATSDPVSATVAIVVEQKPAQVRADGNQQTGTVGGQLPSPLAMQVNDRLGNSISQVGVVFTIVQGQGALNSPSGVSGSDGWVRTRWTLGTRATADGGHQDVNAMVSSTPTLTTDFTAIATADVAASITKPFVSGDGQSGPTCRPLGKPIQARILDQYGNGVQATNVGYVVTGGFGSANPTSVLSDATGYAATSWTLGPNPGSLQTLEARAIGLTGSPATFTAMTIGGVSDTTSTHC